MGNAPPPFYSFLLVAYNAQMQEAGSPPSDLVGSMPSAQEALSMPDDQCNPQ